MYLKSNNLLTNTLSTLGLYPYHQMATAGNQHVALFHTKDTFIFLKEPLKKLVFLKKLKVAQTLLPKGVGRYLRGLFFKE